MHYLKLTVRDYECLTAIQADLSIHQEAKQKRRCSTLHHTSVCYRYHSPAQFVQHNNATPARCTGVSNLLTSLSVPPPSPSCNGRSLVMRRRTALDSSSTLLCTLQTIDQCIASCFLKHPLIRCPFLTSWSLVLEELFSSPPT